MSVCKPPTDGGASDDIGPNDIAVSSRLIVVGVSVRGAAWSLRRAGVTPYALDAFADADLVELCGPFGRALSIARFPDGLADAWSDTPLVPWLYAGGLENDPDLLDRLATSRLLYGNPGHIVRQARDPAVVYDILRRERILVPEIRSAASPLLTGRWMRKPLRSGGGLGVARVDFDQRSIDAPSDGVPGAQRSPCGASTFFYQQWIDGLSCGATFVGANGEARLLGVCEQLHGRTWPEPGEFHYAGSIGPLTLDADTTRRIETLGQVLTRQLGLSGVFGIDVVLADGIPWPIEINPRWPASAELIERATGVSIAVTHWNACASGRLPDVAATAVHPSHEQVAGKLVLYTTRELTWTADDTRRWLDARGPSPLERPRYADIPAGPQVIPAHSPLMTLLTDGRTFAQVRADLADRRRVFADGI